MQRGRFRSWVRCAGASSQLDTADGRAGAACEFVLPPGPQEAVDLETGGGVGGADGERAPRKADDFGVTGEVRGHDSAPGVSDAAGGTVLPLDLAAQSCEGCVQGTIRVRAVAKLPEAGEILVEAAEVQGRLLFVVGGGKRECTTSSQLG
jgi:hypothetical protein